MADEVNFANSGLSIGSVVFFEKLKDWAHQVDKIMPELLELVDRPPSSKHRTLCLEQPAVSTLSCFSEELQVLKQRCSDDYNQLFETTQDFDEFLENAQDKLKLAERRLNSCRVHLLKYGLKPMPVDKNERKMPTSPRNLVCDSTPLPQPLTRDVEKTPELIDYGISKYSMDVLLSTQKTVSITGLSKSMPKKDADICLKNSNNLVSTTNSARLQASMNTPIPFKNSNIHATPQQFSYSSYNKLQEYKGDMHTPMQDIYENMNDTLPDTPEMTSSLAALSFFDKTIVEADSNRLATPELSNVLQQNTPEEPNIPSDSKMAVPPEVEKELVPTPANSVSIDRLWINNKQRASRLLNREQLGQDGRQICKA